MSSFTVDINLIVTNAENTGLREPKEGKNWIDFWCLNTGHSDNHLNCACCNKDIYLDVHADEELEKKLADRLHQDKMFDRVKLDATTDVYKADGGHIENLEQVRFLKTEHKSSSPYYIVPLCKQCNGKKGEKITIQKGTVYVPENGCKVVKFREKENK